MAKAELVSAAEFARRQKISAEMVRKAKAQGVFKGALVKVPGKKKPLLKYKLAVRYYESRLDPMFRKANQTPQKKAKGGNGDAPQRRGADKTFVEARRNVEQYKAKELKLKHEIAKGLWIKRADVADQAYRAARLARDNFLNIPARVSALVAAESSASRCFGILHKEIKQVLDDYIDQIKQVAKQRGKNERTN